MIVMDEGIRAIVFAGFSDCADYLAAISVNPDGPGFLMQARVRWHTDKPTGDVFLDDDRKRWFSGVLNRSLDDAIAGVRDVGLTLCEHAAWAKMLTGDTQVYVLIRGNDSVDEFAKRLESMPFAYKKLQH